MTRIAVDAMGGDHAPSEIVKGAIWAAHEYNVPIELVGREDAINEELEKIKKQGIKVTVIIHSQPNQLNFLFIKPKTFKGSVL